MKIASKVALLALVWLILINPGSITGVDTYRRMQMAHAWWTGTEEGLPGDDLVINVRGNNYIPYDLGQSMLMLPGDWLGTQIGTQMGQWLPTEELQIQFRQAIVSFLIFLPLNVLSVIFCFRLLRRFNYEEKLSGLSTIVWLLGTTFFFYSAIDQQNNQILLFVLIGYETALAYVLSQKPKFAVFSGLALGISFLIRITSIIHAASVGFFWLGCIAYKTKSVNRVFKSLGLWICGFIPLVLLERILTYIRYGSWLATTPSLHIQAHAQAQAQALSDGSHSVTVTNDLSYFNLLKESHLDGFLVPLFSPEKSIFLYDPLLLPCLILGFVAWKRLSPYIQWYVIVTILNLLIHLLIYAWTSNPGGDSSWGARYHVTSVHLLLIPLLPLLIQRVTCLVGKGLALQKVIFTRILRIVLALAICIQLLSVALPYNLEIAQQQLGIGSRFRIIQRFENVAYLLSNSLDKATPGEIKTSNSQASNVISYFSHWNFFPFLLSRKIQPSSSLYKILPIIFVLWGLLFLLATCTTFWIAHVLQKK